MPNDKKATTSLNDFKLDLKKIPKHIAVIMDGNGRWAKRRGWVRTLGHKAGAETLREVVTICGQLGVEVLTAYAFSTENWKRPSYEVNFLMNLFNVYLSKEISNLNKENVRVVFSGDISKLPAKVAKKARAAMETTASNTGLILNLAVNYGGQAEILRAVNNILADYATGKISAGLTEDMFSRYLYTAGMPEVDLLIRPGGDLRISNFLLWQIAYAEIWFTKEYWPDIKKEHLYQAIYDFQNRDRRFGGLNKK